MCGCNRRMGLPCGFHQRKEDALRSVPAFRFLAEAVEPPKPTPVPDYIERIRAGTD